MNGLVWGGIFAGYVLAASLATAESAPDIMTFWRAFFARPPASPAESPLANERIALGRRLFSDPRLSGSGTRSCASCHKPDHAFADGRPRAAALSGEALARNTPALWNLASSPFLNWDGSAATLEAQAHGPIERASEMAASWPLIVARLEGDPALRTLFSRAFPESPSASKDTVTRALAAFERSLVSPETRFDRWIEGEAAALDAAEIAGFELFTGKAGCVGCHAGWRFTDDGFHDIGLPGDDPGRGAAPTGIPGLAAFKTPGLRELVWTAPYMHDGSQSSLDAVLDHYMGGIVGRAGVASHLVRPLVLNAEERARLLAFLRALSSETAPVSPNENGR